MYFDLVCNLLVAVGPFWLRIFFDTSQTFALCCGTVQPYSLTIRYIHCVLFISETSVLALPRSNHHFLSKDLLGAFGFANCSKTSKTYWDMMNLYILVLSIYNRIPQASPQLYTYVPKWCEQQDITQVRNHNSQVTRYIISLKRWRAKIWI